MDWGYYNGKVSELSEVKVPLNDRAMYFGDGVYDATVCKNGVILDFEDHIERFRSSLKLLGIPEPAEDRILKEDLLQMAERGDTGKWYMIYWSATRATAPRQHRFPEQKPSNLIITLNELPGLASSDVPLKLITYEDHRFEYCHIKTLNLIPSCLAAEKAYEAGCDEAVFHRGNEVTECAHSNISILKDGKLITAPADHWILPGIGRKYLLESAKKIGIPVIEEQFTLGELFDADEIIVTSSGGQCSYAEQIDGKAVGRKDRMRFHQLRDVTLERIEAYMGFPL